MTDQLAMEIRSVDTSERMLVGVVAPYDQTTYLVADPGGERIARGAFAKSIRQRADKVPLHDNHGTQRRLGVSKSFEDGDDGLVGTFSIIAGRLGDDLLDDLRNGALGGMSVGFQPLVTTRGDDGAREVREAKLVEVSVVGHPAYDGAGILAVRRAQLVQEDLMAPFLNPPVVNLEPIPRIW